MSRKNRSKKDPRGSRAKPEIVEIRVLTKDGSAHAGWHTAHLRRKGRYLYLCWREEERVRTLYLGRAANS